MTPSALLMMITTWTLVTFFTLRFFLRLLGVSIKKGPAEVKESQTADTGAKASGR